MPLIPNEIIKDVISKNDIVEVISSYMPLEKHGKDFKAVCPFHDDTNPSLSVSSSKQIFNCFVCGEKGNVITFVQKYENISFTQAVKKLADRAGITLEVTNYKKEIDPSISKLHNLLKEVQNYATYSLYTEEGREALNYLHEVRRLDDESIKSFQIGYVPSSEQMIKFLEYKGYTTSEMNEAGILNYDYGNAYSFLKGRIAFPVHSPTGNVIGFSCRTLPNEKGAKYINSPESKIFTKGNTLFNLDQARNAALAKKEIVVMEGQMNPIKAKTIGLDNCVAQMGTALTEQQIKLLKQLNVSVKLMYDGDHAGQLHTHKNYELLRAAGIPTKAVLLPDGLDPDEMIDKDTEAFKKLFHQNTNILDYQLQQTIPDMQNFEALEKYTKTFLIHLEKINDPLTEDFYLRKLSDKTGFSQTALEKKFALLKPKNIQVKIDKQKRKVKASNYTKEKKALIKFSIKPKMKFSDEISKNYDRLKADNKVFIYDKQHEMERKDLLKKYLNLKGTVLESTITLLNCEKSDIEYLAKGISENAARNIADELNIPYSNIDYVSYLHLDTKYPHIHLQLFQKETYLEQYELSSKMVTQLEKTINAVLKSEITADPTPDMEVMTSISI